MTVGRPSRGSRRDRSRAVALDIGAKRIGVALSDSGRTTATPYEVVERTAVRAHDYERIVELVAETGADAVVVGLPLSLDGTIGRAARAILDEVEELRRVLPVQVLTWDERLTTVEAERSLQTMGIKGPARRRFVDQLAATVILQSWLDAGSPQG